MRIYFWPEIFIMHVAKQIIINGHLCLYPILLLILCLYSINWDISAKSNWCWLVTAASGVTVELDWERAEGLFGILPVL